MYGTLWTTMQIELLKKEYAEASEPDLLRGLTPHSWNGIRLKASRLLLKRDRNRYGVPRKLPNGKPNPEYGRRWRVANMERTRENQRWWRELNPEQNRQNHRWEMWRRRDGVNPQIAQQIYDSSSRCAICGLAVVEGKKKHLDCDHKTHKVRGVLCGNCNRLIGIVHEDISVLQNAINYLSRGEAQ